MKHDITSIFEERSTPGRIALIAITLLAVSALVLSLAGCHSARRSEEADTFDANAIRDTEQQVAEEQPAAEPAPAPQETPTPTSSGVVVIDPGHQGEGDSTQEPIGPGASETKARVTSGTSGVATGTPESEVNLEIALKLRDSLEARGVTVILVRDSEDVNISNSERAAVANENNADLFIRLHCDGIDDSSVSGFLTLVPGENEWTEDIYAESQRAGDIMHPIIISETGASDRGVVVRNDLSGFNWCDVPCVLFEMGCMSNPDEDMALGSEEYQQALADAMADATVAYLNS